MIESYKEAPELTRAVRSGGLPAVSCRLPVRPLAVDTGEEMETGRYGGSVTFGEITPGFCHYLRHMNEAALLETGAFSGQHPYSKLDGPVFPGVFEEWESSADGMRHTFRIREGLRWSDGEPVTTEDARYAVENVLLNPKLAKFLTNSEHSLILMPEWEWLMWGDEPVKITLWDKFRFSLIFARPYHIFIRHQVRSARWQMLLRPSHYVKQFHEDFADAGMLKIRMEQDGFADREWAEYYQYRDPAIREAGYHLPVRIPEIWNYPVLDPWVFTEDSTRDLMRLTRNPYYYAVDREGNQLPYLDGLTRILYPDTEALRKAEWSGELDVCGCFTKITDAAEWSRRTGRNQNSMLRLKLLPLWQVQQVILLINLCPEQEWMRPFLIDVRFRQAVSLSIDRERLRREVFAGYGTPSQLTCAKKRSWYREEYARAFADYLPEEAERLFAEAGLVKEEKNGRYTFEGRSVVFRMIWYPVTPMADEVGKRIAEDLTRAGLEIEVIRLNSGSEMGPYQEANSHVFTIWEMAGDDPLIPYQIGGLSDPAPLWWKWYETGGREGVEPTEEGKQLYRLRDALKTAGTEEERNAIAKQAYRLQAENLWCIGTAAEAPQPLVYSAELKNVAGEKEVFLPGVLGGARKWGRQSARRSGIQQQYEGTG